MIPTPTPKSAPPLICPQGVGAVAICDHDDDRGGEPVGARGVRVPRPSSSLCSPPFALPSERGPPGARCPRLAPRSRADGAREPGGEHPPDADCPLWGMVLMPGAVPPSRSLPRPSTNDRHSLTLPPSIPLGVTPRPPAAWPCADGPRFGDIRVRFACIRRRSAPPRGWPRCKDNPSLSIFRSRCIGRGAASAAHSSRGSKDVQGPGEEGTSPSWSHPQCWLVSGTFS